MPQPPADSSHWVIAEDEALTGSESTAVFHGFDAVKSPVPPPPELPEELLVDDELEATLLDATLLDDVLDEEEELDDDELVWPPELELELELE